MNLLTSKGIGIALPDNQKSKNDIYQLRYTCYQHADALESTKVKSMQDSYDTQISTINLVASKKNEVVGAIRGCLHLPYNNSMLLPSLSAYKNEIINEIGLDKSIYESCRFVVHPDTDSKLRVHFTLIKAAILTAWSLDLDYIITACRKRHMEFYTRMGMRPISDEKIYPGLKVPMILLASEISEAKRVLLSETYKALAFDGSDLFTYRNKLLYSKPALENYLNLQSPNHVRA